LVALATHTTESIGTFLSKEYLQKSVRVILAHGFKALDLRQVPDGTIHWTLLGKISLTETCDAFDARHVTKVIQ
jgi:hypothetical protein